MPGYADEFDAVAERLTDAADMDEQDTKPRDHRATAFVKYIHGSESSSLAQSPRSKRSPRPTGNLLLT